LTHCNLTGCFCVLGSSRLPVVVLTYLWVPGDADKKSAEQRKVKAMKWKLERAANADVVNVHGTCALSLAAGFGSPGMVQALLEDGAKLQVNNAKWTALHYAARFGLNGETSCWPRAVDAS
jgi:ankyrin repeat protein